MSRPRSHVDHTTLNLAPAVWFLAVLVVVLAAWCIWVVRSMQDVRLEWRRNLDRIGELSQVASDIEKLALAESVPPASSLRTVSHRLIGVARAVLDDAPAGSDSAAAAGLVVRATVRAMESWSREMEPPGHTQIKERLRGLAPLVSELGVALRGWDDRISARLEAESHSLDALGGTSLAMGVFNLAFLVAWDRRRLRSLRHLAERNEAEAAKRRADASFRALIEAVPDAILVTQGGRVSYANPAAVTDLGYKGESELLGLPESEMVLPPDTLDPPAGGPVGRHLLRELTLRRKSGDAMKAEVLRLSLLFDSVPATVTIARDVTERIRMQELLLIAERMASVGTLAAGVGHEINNPLTYVLTNLDLMGRILARQSLAEPLSPRDQADLREMVQECQEGADRIRRIVRDLKVFARGDDETMGPVDVASVIESAANMTLGEIKHRAQLVRDIQADLPRARANEARLGQVVVNLLVNAAQAIREGSVMRNEIRVSARRHEGERIAIEVADTGSGIPPGNLSHIFEPFFTTKPLGEGTGLGLFVCHRIVAGFGGEISAHPRPGGGSIFRVVIPVASASDEFTPKPRLPSHETEPRGRVLVVDDEPLVAAAIRRILVPHHDVSVVQRAEDALALLGARERFDVILTDLMMPEMTGMDLYDELAQTNPEQIERMVFITGGVFTPAAREFLDRVPNARLGKPFEEHELRALVRAKLATSGVAAA